MIPFAVVLGTGSLLSLAAGGSDALFLTLSAAVLGMGLMDITAGIAGRLSGDDESEELEGEDDFGAEGGDPGDDEFGDLGDWDEEEDELDDFGEGGSGLNEIEPRLDELENEIASVTSTMGTVRSENEAITETVDDIEDNIRKLLEIYEMVTRGVNPFVDDAEGSAGMGSSFGLFEGAASADDDIEDLDPDLAEADADSFFDDDWDDGNFEDDEGFGDDEFDGAAVGSDDPAGDVDGSETEEGGKTFDQLKSEYEAGDTDWAEEGEEVATGSGGVFPGGEVPPENADGGENDGLTADVDTRDPHVRPTDANGAGAATKTSGATPAGDSDPVGEDETGAAATTDPPSAVDEPSGSDGKPYLRALPGGYGAELLVIEWLSYLRSCSSTSEALRAIRYYETIGWIGESAANALAKFLTGLSNGNAGPVPSGGTQLTVDHHTKSLRYIGRLGGADVQIERLDWTESPRQGARIEGGKQRGIQR